MKHVNADAFANSKCCGNFDDAACVRIFHWYTLESEQKREERNHRLFAD